MGTRLRFVPALPAVLLSPFLLALGSVWAADPGADVGPLLSAAQRAWTRGDDLGEKARQTLLSAEGNSQSYLGLRNGQDQEYEAAEASFLDALKRNPNHRHALAEYGRFLIARKRFAHAAVKLEQALRPHPRPELELFAPPERADLHRALGGVLERGGRWEQALQHYRNAYALNASDPRNRISLAVGFCAAGEYAQAIGLLQPWASAAGPGQALNPEQRAFGLYTLAYAQEQSGLLHEARVAYTQARDLAALAGAKETTGIAEQAKLALRRMQPFLKELDAKPAVRASFAKAHVLCEEGVRSKHEALRAREAYDEAVAAFFRISSAKSAPPACQLFRPLPVAMHRLLEDLQAWPAAFHHAVTCFKAAIAAWPRLARAHQELGWCLVALGDVEMAHGHLSAAALYDPLSLHVLVRDASVRYSLEDWEGAHEVFSKLARIDPEYGPARLGLAQAAAALRRSSKELAQARDHLDLAEHLGADGLRAGALRAQVDGMLAKLERGERLPPAPRRFGARRAAAPSQVTEPAAPFITPGLLEP